MKKERIINRLKTTLAGKRFNSDWARKMNFLYQ